MGAQQVPRVWEIDWSSDGTGAELPWAAYPWALAVARERGTGVSIVAGAFKTFRNFGPGLGHARAAALYAGSHRYSDQGVVVSAVPATRRFHVGGVVLVAMASDERLAHVEGQRPVAVAAVADWPDAIVEWRSLHQPPRIGESRPDQEAEFDAEPSPPLDPRAVELLRSAGALVNTNHAVLSTHERQRVAGALVALRQAEIPVADAALRAHLMSHGWGGPLIDQVAALAGRVRVGQTPRHDPMSVPAAGEGKAP